MTTKRERWERIKVANAKVNMPQHKDQSSVPVWAQHPRQHPTPQMGEKDDTGQPNGQRKPEYSSTH